MTLVPESRVLLTDALRPPAGHRVDVVVGTTYSLDLTALLLAPLSFAVSEQVEGDVSRVDPIRLLEAVRRHTEHTTVFCQAGGIHVPSRYRSILTFVEDSVVEVTAPAEDAIFHPKLWALRFAGPGGAVSHRVVILSRNMTFDRSWDTALVLNEASDGAIDAAPAADFVRGLPARALRGLPADRTRQVDDLASTLATVRLAAPTPFTGGALLPIGLDGADVWPFPERAYRVLAISPFLTRQAVRALGHVADERTLVSRAESLDLLGSDALTGWKVDVLQRLVEVEPDGDVAESQPARSEFESGTAGLHAKTFVVDLPDGTSMTVTGSANLTGAPWGRSVEFGAKLTGPTAACGVASVLDGSPGVPGLSALLQDYHPATTAGVDDPAIETSYTLERFHRFLASNLPVTHVARLDDDRAQLSVSVEIPPFVPGMTRIWPVSLPDGHAQPLAPTTTWTLAHLNVTPFLVVETTAGDGDARVTRRCVLMGDLRGDVDSRRHDAIFDVLRSKQDVLRYLLFLLGDPSYDALLAEIAGSGEEGFHPESRGTRQDVALLEPLIRAIGRDDDALARVASLVEDLRAMPNGHELVPDDFDTLWDAVWQVHREARR
ncbi:phospholipase D family protein [Cellulomonas wangsupingiae]|uniref:Phospholipase D family protein n=1 Tax=Cellulomonas wangsupingiae TaxID=2968085 RepID=A0ABY5K345_9CELL|nr:phospholipase D family protein [Cellulomonas wangsupingiae]MCC2333611.1 phospholipase D family protein [Cellulomonas wangsupingiae]UUI64879.1 phospholipase D family protein [Cellulomonas wangsupingiae]